MKLSKQLKPISDLKAHEPTILRTLKDHSQPVVITLHGEAKAVLQDVGQYEEHRRRWRSPTGRSRRANCAPLRNPSHGSANVWPTANP